MPEIKIFDALPEEEILAQMAEECVEASKAALKLRRVRSGVNPTPVSEKDAFENLVEELAMFTFAASSSSAVSWTTTTPAICVMRSATGWSRSWSRSSPAGSTA